MARIAKRTPEQTLVMIREEAIAMRDAGLTVLEIEADGCRVRLAPSMGGPAPADALIPVQPADDPDPLNDGSTFGLPPGVAPPGFKHRVQKDET